LSTFRPPKTDEKNCRVFFFDDFGSVGNIGSVGMGALGVLGSVGSVERCALGKNENFAGSVPRGVSNDLSRTPLGVTIIFISI